MAKFVGVYLLDTVYKIDKIYEYSLDERHAQKAARGKLAVVPFGNANTAKNAVIVSVSDTSQYKKTKPVFDIPDTDFCLSDELLDICSYMKEICFCTFGEAVRTVMPTGISVRPYEYYAPSAVPFDDIEELNEPSRDIFSFISGRGKTTSAELEEEFGKSAKICVSALIKLGYIVKQSDAKYHENTKISRYIKLILSETELSEMIECGTRAFSAKQLLVLKTLMDCGGINPLEELTTLCNCGESVIRELKKKKAVEYVAVKDYRSPYNPEKIEKTEDFSLSEEQTEAFQTLKDLYFDKAARAALLYGITGSGKTNVVLKLIDEAVHDGKSVIYLVPEIALTNQNISIFVGRFGERVSVLHSALSVGEKLDAWRKIDSGESDIVIGTRSAIFAPVKNLGLIVIDEEQETSFKSDMSPKYHARDIARFRCAKKNALMVLASATPSVESFYRANSERYTLVTMKKRYGGAKLPAVIIHDMKPEPAYMGESGNSTPSMIGASLDAEIRKNLERGEQTILFINRRGYHSFVTCRSCGEVTTCPNCSVSLTYHKYERHDRFKKGEMVCHYCGYRQDVPKLCTKCGSEHIAFLGYGTQTLEENLGSLYPDAKVLRMDTDTTSGKYSHTEILNKFRNKEADILIGTQMVAKGHDFPNVTLVGVILADTSLYLNDFRANEKTFSLITQVLGRSGRGNCPGRAVIQTYSPDNLTLRLSASQDYDAFYNDEIQLRRASVFPPFCDIVSFMFSGEDEIRVKNISSAFGKALDLYAKTEFKGTRLIVFGPFEAAIYKINGKYRMRYIIKCRYDKGTRELFKKLFSDFCDTPGIILSADVNPSSL